MVTKTDAKCDGDTTCTGMMPAGRYWVGDLCYVLHDAWDDVCQLGEGVHTLTDGRCVAMFATLHGDGIYDDDHGNCYGVDSGTLGCILADDIRDTSASTDLGVFVTAADPFTPRRTYPAGASRRFDAGVLHLAGVRINLDGEAEDD